MNAYKNYYEDYSRNELLEEMVSFSKRDKNSSFWTLSMITRGIDLYERLLETSETDALRLLCSSYLKFLKDMLKDKPLYENNIIPFRRKSA